MNVGLMFDFVFCRVLLFILFMFNVLFLMSLMILFMMRWGIGKWLLFCFVMWMSFDVRWVIVNELNLLSGLSNDEGDCWLLNCVFL